MNINDDRVVDGFAEACRKIDKISAEIDRLMKENANLTARTEVAEAMLKTYRQLPEEFHHGMLEILVQCAYENGAISISRAAELLGVPVQEVQEKSWFQRGTHGTAENASTNLKNLAAASEGFAFPGSAIAKIATAGAAEIDRLTAELADQRAAIARLDADNERLHEAVADEHMRGDEAREAARRLWKEGWSHRIADRRGQNLLKRWPWLEED